MGNSKRTFLAIAATCCCALAASAQGIRAPQSMAFTLSGGEPVSFTIDTARAKFVERNGSLIIENCITSFELVFKGIKSSLTREYLGGDDAVNLVEIDGKTVVIRVTTKGTGSGPGNIGGSVVVILNLDKSIRGSGKKLLASAEGKLAQGDLKNERTYVLSDMSAVGVASIKYTSILSDQDEGAMFKGFVVFDPTNPGSRGDAYFEMTNLMESENAWTWKPIP